MLKESFANARNSFGRNTKRTMSYPQLLCSFRLSSLKARRQRQEWNWTEPRLWPPQTGTGFASLQFALASASFFLSSDNPESSRMRLQQVLQEARGPSFVGVEFEARFALAELNRKSAGTAPMRKHN